MSRAALDSGGAIASLGHGHAYAFRPSNRLRSVEFNLSYQESSNGDQSV